MFLLDLLFKRKGKKDFQLVAFYRRNKHLEMSSLKQMEQNTLSNSSDDSFVNNTSNEIETTIFPSSTR